MKTVLILLAAALILVGCDLATTSNTGKTPSAATPSVHGSVILAVSGGSLPAGAQVRVALTVNNPELSLAGSRAPSTVPTGDYHRDIPVSVAGTFAYEVTGVPDGTYTIQITLIDSSSHALSNTGAQTIQVTGGAYAVPDFNINYSVPSVE